MILSRTSDRIARDTLCAVALHCNNMFENRLCDIRPVCRIAAAARSRLNELLSRCLVFGKKAATVNVHFKLGDPVPKALKAASDERLVLVGSEMR